jgi:hypothetical protein
MADTATATTPKKKINRTPLNYLLVAVRKDSNGEIQGFDAVKQPDLSEKKNPSRNDYKRAVRKALEAGENADDYNGKQLPVLSFPEPFCLSAAVEEVTVRKVSISES